MRPRSINDPRMTSYMIPYPNDDAALKAVVARLVKNGWYAKGYFYPIDEPVDKQAYGALAKISDRLQQCAHRLSLGGAFLSPPQLGRPNHRLRLDG